MATLVLTAVGTALGGPLGGALGALAGRSLDAAIIGSPRREGARIKDLNVTTSSYGSVVPRHFGRMRAPGTVIWSTELVEQRETSGGGKGKPKVTSYSYSISFAVALSSRPIASIGRIWADGNLLRGAAGDLKIGGSLRLYYGHADQSVDPLIAADVGTANCPAFRGIAYAVFENLQLADYGNRIPALTFEIFAGDEAISVADLVELAASLPDEMLLPDLAGISHEGGTYAQLLAEIDALFPLACNSEGNLLAISSAAARSETTVIELPPPVRGTDGDFAPDTGARRTRDGETRHGQVSLRYYDVARDYQPGLQRSRGRGSHEGVREIEFPASLSADRARMLADEAAVRETGRRETMAFRVAELDGDVMPGAFVRPAGDRGLWRVVAWEWRANGIELELEAVSPALSAGLAAGGDAGRSNLPADVANGPTILSAFGLPWDGIGSSDTPRLFAAVSSSFRGWTGAALYADAGSGSLVPLGPAERARAIIGTAENAMGAASPHLLDREAQLTVQLADPGFALTATDLAGLAAGANRIRVGEEILQYRDAESLGGGRWRLSCLLRGRGGTESTIVSHLPGEAFVALDERLTPLDTALLADPPAQSIVALGHADAEPVSAPLHDRGATLRPLSPVHPAIVVSADGAMTLKWSRRSRGAWRWTDLVVPLNESSEAYEIILIDGEGTETLWHTADPELMLDAPQYGAILASPAPARFEIRQIGQYARSDPLNLPLPA